jgi:hypothetical protein
MASYTKTSPGAPDSGIYAFGDQVTDSLNVVHQCVRAGIPGTWVTTAPVIAAAGTTATIGTPAAVSGLVVTDFGGAGILRRTRFTLTDVAQTVVNGTEHQGTKLFTFPEGRIYVLGTVATLAQKTTSAILTTLNSATGAVALGTVTSSATTLSGTMVDLAPSTAFTSSATINVAGTAVTLVLTAAAFFDGTTTAKEVYLNSAYATTTDVDADATQTWTGTIDITWMHLGDK